MFAKKCVGVVLGMALMASGVATAQSEEAKEVFGGKHIMLLMDANGDGKISMEESPEQLQQSYAMVDVDSSGGIDEAEAEMIAVFVAGEYGMDVSADEIMLKMIIDNSDTNDDGKLNRDEAGDEIGANFAEIDVNHDGWIDEKEGVAIVAALKAGNRGGPTEVTAADVLSNLDADGDGKITMEESPEQLQQSFAMVDANGDGGIDLTEAQLIADFMNN